MRLLACAFFLLCSTPTLAYTPRAYGVCNDIQWASSPRVIVHTAEALGFTLAESFQMLDAVVDIHAEFNAVNDTTAAVTTQTLSSVPFTYQSWVFDAVPTIHVGFTSDPNAAIGSTDWRVDQGNCTILEAHIAFQDANLIPWLLQEPTEEGYDYWDVEHNINTTWWFRIAYMHELLHAFGAAHSNNSYSYLNYSDRPFANRIAGHRVMPLPDDMEYLRDYYPSNGTQYEVAVLTTWYTPTAAGGSYPAANQYRLCQPSTGVAWGSTTTEGACATSSSYDVCPGDTIYTRFAVANYGTSQADLTARLWMSLDSVYGGDIRATQARAFSVGANASSRQGRWFTVPTGVAYDTDYFTIIRVNGTSNGVGVADNIPMRGMLHVKPQAQC